jgi:transcriptional regulator
MYIPPAFEQPDLAAMQQTMERHSFALLISAESGLEASHLPLLLDRQAGRYGTLIGHMARANPQWQAASGREVLVIFSGPHAYISPSWYEAPHTVPTWNYIAVHAYGRLERVEEEADSIALLKQTVAAYEAGQPQPWLLPESPEFVAKLAAQIVAFRIPIERLEGKWKLNQNRPIEQQARVIERLTEQADENAMAIAAAMHDLTRRALA